jgi:hypothetical protein
MAEFIFGVKAGLADDAVFSAALGVNVAGKLTSLDSFKVVKLIGDSRYGLAIDGDSIEGFLIAVEPSTVNNGFGFGSIQCKENFIVSNAGAGAIAVGALVVAAAQPAVGTALATVASGPLTGNRAAPVRAAAGAELTRPFFNWRVTSLLRGNGGVGTQILIERI